MRAFFFACLCILLAPIAAGGAGSASWLLSRDDGAKPLAARTHPLNENEAEPHRRSVAATLERTGDLDRGIADQRREMREMAAELGSEARQQTLKAADTASQAFQAADTASQAFQAADTASQELQETKEQIRESIRDAKAQAKDAKDAARAQVREAIREAEAQVREASALAKDAGADAALAQARRLRMQGKYDEAAKAYRKFIAENPDSSRLYEARFWLAKCKLSGQKWDEAAEAFTDFLKHHSDQRTYSQQAKEDRIYCWKTRFDRNPKAAPGLRAALKDPDTDIRVQAALALAESKDASGRAVLEENLNHARLGEQCGLALWKLGLRDKPKTGESPSPWAKMLVIKVKSADPNDSFEMRVPVHFFKGVEKMLPEEAKDEMARKGLGNITDLAATAPKGQVLFQFRGDNGRTTVVISVD